MPALTILSPSEQVAKYLRGQLYRGRWTGVMPGAPALSVELGVDSKTIAAALRLLEQEKILIWEGGGRACTIHAPSANRTVRRLRIGVIVGDRSDRNLDYVIELQSQLAQAGNMIVQSARTLSELKMEVPRLVQMVGQYQVDAWIVMAGSRGALEWFAREQVPTLAIFGRRRALRIAGIGPDKLPVYSLAARRLMELGHRRIIMLSRKMRRIPSPGAAEQAFLDELEAAGLPTGPYNLPDWDESPSGFNSLLESLFRHTPPTALMIDEAPFLVAAMQFFNSRGINIPGDVSIVCSDPDTAFDWCNLEIAHIRWDSKPLVRRVVQWAANISKGIDDRRQGYTKAELIEGGTIGPAPEQ